MIVYVLELADGHYYVGRIDNLTARLEAHANGRGSEWTKQYPTIQLKGTYEETSPFYEDMITKIMMAKYRISKVRGGSYSQVFLPKSKHFAIVSELRGAKGTCFRCGGSHFVRSCKEPRTDVGDPPEEMVEESGLAYRLLQVHIVKQPEQ
ncbi:hypothetical protein PHYSODRAFT_507023 [Phytophthora sojae]|uniref:GIY-YIG domain-containing protein n=1 Tax=Phytophthora sojae (strain P6497) TaxID=1094619 RepID=G4ZQD2_PHYSP|nr:hypothetical protein PHYSODRAFT_507023 [Phytophthora sojae]EGZ15167.1 hypothetical protein PHYSODRAFT_507023 [Phytophthora sojae]|eukprot:XP_009528916.1 hypothetical protein PHYSODRAFT_507023 [Phytophthora sojae]